MHFGIFWPFEKSFLGIGSIWKISTSWFRGYLTFWNWTMFSHGSWGMGHLLHRTYWGTCSTVHTGAPAPPYILGYLLHRTYWGTCSTVHTGEPAPPYILGNLLHRTYIALDRQSRGPGFNPQSGLDINFQFRIYPAYSWGVLVETLEPSAAHLQHSAAPLELST